MPPRVLVVGGGLAGVSAALALADGGHDVELLEARPRLGGAACSFRRGALTVDNGQHVFLRCCTEYLAFLRRLGATGHVTLQPRLSVPVLRPGGPAGRLWRDPLPAPLHLARALGGYVHLPFRQRLGVVRTALAMYRLDPADPVLDRRTLGDWLAARGQSRAAVEVLWDLIGRATLNATASDASLALAAMVFRTGLLTRAGAADLGYPRVPLGDLHDTLAERALRDAGARVRRRSRVIGVAAHEDGVRAWLAGGVTVSADAVILAVPHDAAARLLPEDAWPGLPRFGGLATSPIVNVHVRYDRQVTDLPFAAGVGSPVQWVFDRTTASG
ncbi:MAG TPA: hydroxysqualene dehydroxylase HpnE, partial [Thermomonospora sp.]|nr:hydroxysqualene dehydroxylase HpnE [Thermomonospora sp.]